MRALSGEQPPGPRDSTQLGPEAEAESKEEEEAEESGRLAAREMRRRRGSAHLNGNTSAANKLTVWPSRHGKLTDEHAKHESSGGGAKIARSFCWPAREMELLAVVVCRTAPPHLYLAAAAAAARRALMLTPNKKVNFFLITIGMHEHHEPPPRRSYLSRPTSAAALPVGRSEFERKWTRRSVKLAADALLCLVAAPVASAAAAAAAEAVAGRRKSSRTACELPNPAKWEQPPLEIDRMRTRTVSF